MKFLTLYHLCSVPKLFSGPTIKTYRSSWDPSPSFTCRWEIRGGGERKEKEGKAMKGHLFLI